MNKLTRTCAYIISNHGFDTYRLLTYKDIDAKPDSYYHTHLHVPTGGDTPTLEEALFKGIEAQTGIPQDDLTLLRPLGKSTGYRLGSDTSVISHHYVLELKTPYPETWSHVYRDNQTLEIQMILPTQLDRVSAEYKRIISELIPELFMV